MDVEEDSPELLPSTQLVENNCEYLTLVRSLSSQRANTLKNALRTLENYMESESPARVRLSYEDLCLLVVQLGYFLFACRQFGMRPSIETSEIRVEEQYVRSNDKKFSVLVFYRMEEKNMEEMEAVTLFGGILEHLETNLSSLLETKGDGEYEVAFEAFMQQYKMIANCEFFQSSESSVFRALQQTNLFYQYSLLYRIKSCSILDFIRLSPNRLQLLKDCKRNDELLLTGYNQERKKFKSDNDNEVLKDKEKQIDSNLLKFFSSVSEHFQEAVPSKNDKESAHRVKFHFQLKEVEKYPFQSFLISPDSNTNSMSEEVKPIEFKRPLMHMEYYIEHSSEKNSICVRLLMPSLKLSLDISDFLMFQSNVLTYEAVNVSIELSESRLQPAEGNKPAPKMVTFKGTSSFNVKEPPLEKILLLMDVTMIASRIYEPQLNPNKSVQTKDTYQKLTAISRKVNHYTKMYMRCAKRVYSE